MLGASQSAAVAGKDVAWVLCDRARRFPDDIFLIWESFAGEMRCWTFGELWHDVRRTASGLIAAGLTPGERLLVHADNSPDVLIAWFASALTGSVVVTTNTAATASELAHFAERARPRLAITDATYLPLVRELPELRHIWLTGRRTTCGNVGGRISSFADLLTAQAAELRPACDPTRPLSIQYTSGSTSRAKGVLWTHGNAVWGARVSAMHQRLGRDDVCLVVLPFFHTNAQTYSVLPALWAGARIVLQPKFSASRFWPISLKHNATRASLVPFCLRALFEHPVPDRHAYRTWGVGAVLPDAEARFRVKVLGWWGMTETISQAIVSDPAADHPFMSMGYVSPAYEIEVRDERGRALAGQIGQLYVRGERGISLFLEYDGEPEATAAAFDEQGWFATGDLARIAESGDVYFEGRLSDIIKCGGENISAAEVETVIAAVEGVRESAVVGRPSQLYGEVPVAFVIASGATSGLEERILERCRRELAAFKVPRAIEWVRELPRAALNKVAKGKLRRGLSPLP